MRNGAIIVGALIVLIVGFVFVTGSDDKADAPGKSAVATTTGAASTDDTAATETGAATTAAPKPKAKPKPSVPTVAFANGKPKGGVQKLAFVKGDTVTFKVSSDVAEEVHVHGFDIKKDIAPGGSATFSFPARFDGKYEVEMEGSAIQIASLEIQP